MNYIKSLFGKEPDQLSYQDVENYFKVPRRENNIIEFKSFRSQGSIEQKLTTIYETICSFLNSEGGVLVWGSPEEDKQNKDNPYHGGLCPLNYFEPDYLINKISGNVTPLPNGVRVYPKESNGNFVYLFEVDQSEYSPHQTGDKYYMRIDGQKRTAPHHYIEALFKKIKYPNLGGYLKLENLKFNKIFHLKVCVFILNHSKLQNEENVFYTLTCTKGKFLYKDIYPKRMQVELGGHQLRDTCLSEILPYGAAPYYCVVIGIDPKELEEGNIQELKLMFGGKNSPMKISSYDLRIDSITQDANELLIKRRENILMHEFPEVSMSEVDKVNLVLNRKS